MLCELLRWLRALVTSPYCTYGSVTQHPCRLEFHLKQKVLRGGQYSEFPCWLRRALTHSNTHTAHEYCCLFYTQSQDSAVLSLTHRLALVFFVSHQAVFCRCLCARVNRCGQRRTLGQFSLPHNYS